MHEADYAVTCSRCGRAAQTDDPFLKEDWEGTRHRNAPIPYAPVCPGCQHAEWHPHCTSLVDKDGVRVDPESDWAAVPPEERDYSMLSRCEYIDLSVAWIEDEDFPEQWTCERCGGTTFEGVHRDYVVSGVQPGSFSGEVS